MSDTPTAPTQYPATGDIMRLVKPREVVVKKTVLDSFEVPVLDLSRERIVEITQWERLRLGDFTSIGTVYLNGVLLKGARVNSVSSSVSNYNDRRCEVELSTPLGVLRLTVDRIIYTEGHIPTTARLVGTEE
jgi:hypothetical protein